MRGWVAAHACGIGSTHEAQGKPCQDAVCALTGPLPFVIACDGRGSAQRSELGAAAGVAAFAALIKRHEDLIRDILGTGRRRNATRPLRWRNLVHNRIIPTLQAELVQLSSEYGLPAKEFEFTVSAAVVGPRHLGWLQLGDSRLVVVRSGSSTPLCPPQNGQYANETCFLHAGDAVVQQTACGLLPIHRVKALIAHTDGLVARFYEPGSRLPGPAFGRIAELLATGAWNQAALQALLGDRSWHRVTGDDHSLAAICKL